MALPATFLDVEISAIQRDHLSPELQRLLRDVENGDVPGTQVANYEECLTEAFEVNHDSLSTTYWFLLEADADELESQPALVLRVDNATDTITRCGTCVPCW